MTKGSGSFVAHEENEPDPFVAQGDLVANGVARDFRVHRLGSDNVTHLVGAATWTCRRKLIDAFATTIFAALGRTNYSALAEPD